MALKKLLMPVWISMLEGFGRDRSAFFDVRVCHPTADSYRDLTPKLIYEKHENGKKTEKRPVCGKSNGFRTGNVHSPSFHDHRGNGDE